MPDFKRGESKKDWLKRCVPITLNEGNAKDSKQAYAICINRWEERQKKSRGENLLDTMSDHLMRKMDKKEEDEAKKKKPASEPQTSPMINEKDRTAQN